MAKRYIEWDADKQSPDDLASEAFEHMVADGLPVEIAAEMSEEVKQRVLSIVEREQLRMQVQRLRPYQVWTWVFCGISILQAFTIMLLAPWWPVFMVEGAVLGLIIHVLIQMWRSM
jgi:hypothetical protein